MRGSRWRCPLCRTLARTPHVRHPILMAILNPEIHLSRVDKELLLLLGGLLVGDLAEMRSNYSFSEVPLSDGEAKRLVEPLEELLSSKKFLESCYFVEELSRGQNADLSRLREIFKFWRGRTGRNKSMSWLHWNEFLRRFSAEIDPETSRRLPRLLQMDFQYFLRMEGVLLTKTPLSPRVVTLILQTISKYEKEVQEARLGEMPLPKGIVISQPKALLDSLKKARESGVGLPTFAAHRVAGIATLVADSAVLFTTRDWGVTGTLSTMAGAIAATATR